MHAVGYAVEWTVSITSHKMKTYLIEMGSLQYRYTYIHPYVYPYVNGIRIVVVAVRASEQASERAIC